MDCAKAQSIFCCQSIRKELPVTVPFGAGTFYIIENECLPKTRALE